MKLLLAVDGSKSANHAVSSLIEHVSWFREKPEVDIVFAHSLVRFNGTIHGISVSDKALEMYYEHDAQEMLAQSKQLLTDAGLAFRTHLLVGEPAEVICRFADEHHSDLIFIGTRGMGTIANLLVGSTATKVLHLAKVPVVLVPLEHKLRAAPQLGPTMRT